jgi:hypothetical protein
MIIQCIALSYSHRFPDADRFIIRQPPFPSSEWKREHDGGEAAQITLEEDNGMITSYVVTKRFSSTLFEGSSGVYSNL